MVAPIWIAETIILVTNAARSPDRYGMLKLMRMLPSITKTSAAAATGLRKVNSRITKTKTTDSTPIRTESER